VVMAAQVVRQDDQVDEEFRGIMRYLITFMMEDPRTISTALEILFIAKAIERIGDHAQNMAEYVIYMVRGRDVRHITVDEIEREVQN
jgi:phosphate transport system protein